MVLQFFIRVDVHSTYWIVNPGQDHQNLKTIVVVNECQQCYNFLCLNDNVAAEVCDIVNSVLNIILI